MALEDLDFADGWQRLLAMIGREKGRYTVYLLKLVFSIAAAILFSIIAIIPALFIFIPAVVAVVAAHAAGMGWNVTTISLAIIFGSLLFLLLIYFVALVCVPGTVFFPAYAMHFLAARYPNLDALLHPAPPSGNAAAPRASAAVRTAPSAAVGRAHWLAKSVLHLILMRSRRGDTDLCT